MRRIVISASFLAFLLSICPGRSYGSVPDWLRAAAQQTTKAYPDDVNAVILLSETETTVKDNGETITHERRVIKVLRPEGRDTAYQAVPFDEETKLNYFKGWSISPRGIE